jgi:hypothetical protein
MTSVVMEAREIFIKGGTAGFPRRGTAKKCAYKFTYKPFETNFSSRSI